MEATSSALDEVARLAHKLSPIEKVKLIEQLTPDLEDALRSEANTAPPRLRSLRGFLRGCTISPEDIAEVRREMWGNFPRKDI